MLTNTMMTDAFGRVQAAVHEAVEGLDTKQLAFRPGKNANSIAWLIWHLARVQDDHIAGLAGHEQIYIADAWTEAFGFPFAIGATGYGHTRDEVAAVRAEALLLLGYYDAVHSKTLDFLHALTGKDYERVVDKRWNPPVTLGVRLVSILSDDLQHAGQAAYVRGLLPS